MNKNESTELSWKIEGKYFRYFTELYVVMCTSWLYLGERRYSFIHSLTSAQGVSDQLLASARFTPGEGAHDTQRKGGSVDPKVGLHNLNEIQILYPCWKSNHDSSDAKPVAQSLDVCIGLNKVDVSFKTSCSNIFQKLMLRYRHAWRSFACMKTLACANVLDLQSSVARLLTALACVAYCVVRLESLSLNVFISRSASADLGATLLSFFVSQFMLQFSAHSQNC